MKLATLILLFLVPSQAQMVCADGAASRADWSISAYLGRNIDGPSQDIEPALSEAGFDAPTRPGFLTRPHDNPQTTGEQMLILTVGRYLKRPFSVGVLYSYADLGGTTGRHKQAGGLAIDSDLEVVALGVFVNDKTLLRSLLEEEIFELIIGLGPAVYFATAEHIQRPQEISKSTKFGLLVDVGLRAPANSRLFVAANLQFRQVGTMEVGPFTATSRDGSKTAVLPKTDVSFSHFCFVFGVGIRF